MKKECLFSGQRLRKLLRPIFNVPLVQVIVLSLFCLLVNGVAQAQDPEYETLFSKKANRNPSNVHLYGSLNFGYSPIFKNRKTYHLKYPALELGVNIRKKYGVGLYINDLITIPRDFRDGAFIDTNDIVTASQIALSLTYKREQEKAWHWLYNLKVGSLVITELNIKENQDFEVNNAWSLMVIPNVGIEANLFPWLAVQASVGYRFLGPQEAFGIRFQRDMHGAVGQISFIVGNLR